MLGHRLERSLDGPVVVGLAAIAAVSVFGGCGAPAGRGAARVALPSTAPVHVQGTVTISIIGTNDLHGRVERVAVLGGYVGILRRIRERDGGGVLLLDAGDMFQGTLESNLVEGASVVRAYNALGYAAAAVGNHEFDYGPAGEAATPASPGDNPLGALRAREAEARFALLSANVLAAVQGAGPDSEQISAFAPSAYVTTAGVTVGLIGVTTIDTPRVTIAANIAGLVIAPLLAITRALAEQMRASGATIVVAVAHAGGRCSRFGSPHDLSSCETGSEIFELAQALPHGLVDVIVAGHTHAGIAHVVNGTAIIESYSRGRAFGRVDLTVDRASNTVVSAEAHAPQDLCQTPEAPMSSCTPGMYEGEEVSVDQSVVEAITEDLDRARVRRMEPLGVRAVAPVRTEYTAESPLGNLVADLMLAARPQADVAIMNGGGIRADLPAGDVTYGDFYEVFPFDNRFALVHLTGAEMGRVLAANLASVGGYLSLAGLRARARCRDGSLDVVLFRPSGRRVRDSDALLAVTSEFLATGGDGVLESLAAPVVEVENGPPLREALIDRLRARRGVLDPSEGQLFDPASPRVSYQGARPVHCLECGACAAHAL